MQHSVIDRKASGFSDTDIKKMGKAHGAKTSISTEFLDATDNYLPTSIDADNVLIFGSNNDWNQELALLIQRSFAKDYKIAKIIGASDFFTIPALTTHENGFSYIIICDALDISVDHLSQLKNHVSTVCSFKIPGLEWKPGEYGKFDIAERAQSILNALNIKTDTSKGLLASLDRREFCLMNSQGLFKRRI